MAGIDLTPQHLNQPISDSEKELTKKLFRNGVFLALSGFGTIPMAICLVRSLWDVKKSIDEDSH